jgi:hypothetical protein
VLDSSETEISDLGDDFGRDEDVRGLALKEERSQIVGVKFERASRGNGTHISMNDGRFSKMKVLKSLGDVEHEFELEEECREEEVSWSARGVSERMKARSRTHDDLETGSRHVSDVVEEIAVLAELADHHDGDSLVLGNADSEL